MGHPVIDVVRARRGTAPGARRDDHRVALVIEGGGMRGVVSAGMTAAIERLGLTDAFDFVVGASAGALNGAALLAGVAQAGADSYHGTLAGSREFLRPLRLLAGRPALNVRWILEHASEGLDADRHERTLASAIPLRCIAVDVDTAEPVEFAGMRTREALWDALLASSRMPWVGGGPVAIDGRRYLDGGLAAAIPVASALAAGATHALVLQTRPEGVPRSSGSALADRLIERHLRRLNPALVGLYRARVPDYERVVGEIARAGQRPGAGPPWILGLRPPAGTPPIAQLERDPRRLAVAAADAERLVEAALGE
jgi:predicted patatin/cPLA2 family phospholipase